MSLDKLQVAVFEDGSGYFYNVKPPGRDFRPRPSCVLTFVLQAEPGEDLNALLERAGKECQRRGIKCPKLPG